MNKKKFLLNFINSHNLAVISTAVNNTPESAVVGFGQTDELEIIFGTNRSSRKYKNIKQNPSVSLVIGWEGGKTLQYEGQARELGSSDISLVENNYWQKVPEARSYNEEEGQTYFLIKPKWIRYTDLSIQPNEIIELSF